jgi:hypothetical protein
MPALLRPNCEWRGRVATSWHGPSQTARGPCHTARGPSHTAGWVLLHSTVGKALAWRLGWSTSEQDERRLYRPRVHGSEVTVCAVSSGQWTRWVLVQTIQVTYHRYHCRTLFRRTVWSGSMWLTVNRWKCAEGCASPATEIFEWMFNTSEHLQALYQFCSLVEM